jgi:hypothetical protein
MTSLAIRPADPTDARRALGSQSRVRCTALAAAPTAWVAVRACGSRSERCSIPVGVSFAPPSPQGDMTGNIAGVGEGRNTRRTGGWSRLPADGAGGVDRDVAVAVKAWAPLRAIVRSPAWMVRSIARCAAGRGVRARRRLGLLERAMESLVPAALLGLAGRPAVRRAAGELAAGRAGGGRIAGDAGSVLDEGAHPVVPARAWLLTTGWRRRGLISLDETPAGAGAPRARRTPR